ncbi:MAG: hypothetical protein LBH58_06505 [Tannerellaceae bacterium]|jgi:hypothetical protein|nr:hypothetical protein [Tannerellaceae bacterium]
MKTFSRRELLKTTVAMAAGSSLLLSRPVKAWAHKSAQASKVVLIRERNLFATSPSPDPDLCAQMLDRALCSLTDRKDPAEAWASILKPTDVVGIKTNVWKELPTPPEMNDLLVARVRSVGIREEDVSVDDRGVKTNPVFVRSTALINIRPMRTHAWSGVGSLLKNYITFAEKLPDYHDDSCASLATLHDLPLVKGKTRLYILVLFTPQFHHLAASTFSEEFTWQYNGLAIGFDPVAVDSVGLRIIEAKRREHFREDRPLNPPAKHIALADARYHLGTADPAKIQLTKLGWDEDSFV